MEIKATLQKPYNESQRTGFIVNYNHKLGYIINETETELQALGYSQEELEQQERERIAHLCLTKREIFLALYEDLGITPDEIEKTINNPKYLIEFRYANEYFRGNPLIDLIGNSLGYTKDQIDYLFINKCLPEKENNLENVENA